MTQDNKISIRFVKGGSGSGHHGHSGRPGKRGGSSLRWVYEGNFKRLHAPRKNSEKLGNSLILNPTKVVDGRDMVNYIDNPILFSDDNNQDDWQELIEQSQCRSAYWRKYAKRKMRRVVKELLKGVRPRLYLAA